MKFIKWNLTRKSNSTSIAWDNKLSSYVIKSGNCIGTVVFKDRDEAHDYMKKGLTTEILADIRLAGYDPQSISYDPENLSFFNIQNGNSYEYEIYEEQNKNELPYGVFEMKVGNHGETMFKPYKKNKETLTIIKNKNLKQLVLDFFNNKIDTGRKDKMGVLLYGPPGNGKTTEVMELFDICEEQKLRIYIISSKFSIDRFAVVRNLLSESNNIFVLEEVTERLHQGVEEILTFLDGENSWSNSITIATTNYPEDMPANLIDRPGRFEQFIEYGNPTKAEVLELGKAFGFNEDDSVCLSGQGLSFDYVSFILSKAKKLNKPVKEARTEEEEKRKRLSQTFKGKIGI